MSEREPGAAGRRSHLRFRGDFKRPADLSRRGPHVADRSPRMIRQHPNEQRTLVLAPQGRDAETISHVLRLNHIDSFICADIGILTNELVAGAGAALITDEALESQNLAPLIDWLAAQPAWSDFPFILLTQPRSVPRKSLALGAL